MNTLPRSLSSGKEQCSILCEDCDWLFTGPYSINTVPGHKFKSNFEALQDSAASGCELCDFLYHEGLSNRSRNEKFDGEPSAEDLLAWSEGPVLVEAIGCNRLASHAEGADLATLDFEKDLGKANGMGFLDGLDFWIVKSNSDMHPPVIKHIASLRVSLVAGEIRAIGGRQIPEKVPFDVALQWVEECSNKHPSCRQIANQALPTRLIDVGSADGSRQPKLFLTGGERGRYIALTHRWGDRRLPITTSKENLEEYLRLIAFETLPPTFQDAFKVVRALGYQFLWIDSICIVQNDLEDWDRECPRMSSVYANAAFTIAGPEAEDAWSGFLHNRDLHEPSRQLFVGLKNGESGTVALCLRSMTRDPVRRFDGQENLARRGWILQERLLSPRVLYFGREQMYFECNSSLACEGFCCPTGSLTMWNVGADKSMLTRGGPDLLEVWYAVVEDYSKRKLTKDGDKLPALAGIAAYFQHELCDEYLAGLWRKDILRGLDWRRMRYEGKWDAEYKSLDHPERRQTWTPSWSWASCNYPVQYQYFLPGRAQNPEISVQSAQISVMGTNPFGQVCIGELVLVGLVKRAGACKVPVSLVTRTDCYWTVKDLETKTEVAIAIMDWPGFCENPLHPEDLLEEEVHCLLLTMSPRGPPQAEGETFGWKALALQKVESSGGTEQFKRVGHLEFDEYVDRHLRESSSERVETWNWWGDCTERTTVRLI